MGPSSWGFGHAAGSFGQCGQAMTPMYGALNKQQQVAGPWSTSRMKDANTSQTACNPPAASLVLDPGQHTMIQESRQMPWGPPQPPAMTNVMAYIGAPGPFQLAFNMFSSQNRAADQGYVMGGANQHHDPSLGGASGEGHVSHSAMLTHAERAASIKEMLESDSGGFQVQAMSGQVLIQSTADSAETSKDDDEIMSENEGSQQTNLFDAMSTRCQMCYCIISRPLMSFHCA